MDKDILIGQLLKEIKKLNKRLDKLEEKGMTEVHYHYHNDTPSYGQLSPNQGPIQPQSPWHQMGQ